MHFHPIAQLFEAMDASDFDALKTSIQQAGQLQPIIRWHGKIVDGRHRFNACIALKIEPKFEDLPEAMKESEVFAKTIALNLHRRHLTTEQRALIAVKLSSLARGRPIKNTAVAVFNQTTVAHLLSVSVDTIQRAKKVTTLGIPELLTAIQAGEISIKKASEIASKMPREQRLALMSLNTALRKKDLEKLRKARVQATNFSTQQLTVERHHIILIDPPWDYKNEAQTTGVNPQFHYPTMTHEQLKKLPVNDVALKNSLLFLWATSHHLPQAFELIEAWGFNYSTSAIWVKPAHVVGAGMFNMSHEFLLVAKRGQGLGTPSVKFKSWIEAKSQRHSTKPIHFQERIELMFPKASKIELFARSKRTGWKSWGNQRMDGE